MSHVGEGYQMGGINATMIFVMVHIYTLQKCIVDFSISQLFRRNKLLYICTVFYEMTVRDMNFDALWTVILCKSIIRHVFYCCFNLVFVLHTPHCLSLYIPRINCKLLRYLTARHRPISNILMKIENLACVFLYVL